MSFCDLGAPSLRAGLLRSEGPYPIGRFPCRWEKSPTRDFEWGVGAEVLVVTLGYMFWKINELSTSTGATRVYRSSERWSEPHLSIMIRFIASPLIAVPSRKPGWFAKQGWPYSDINNWPCAMGNHAPQ